MAAAVVDDEHQLAADEEFARRLQREEFQDLVPQIARRRSSDRSRNGDISAPLLDPNAANLNENENNDLNGANNNANDPNRPNAQNAVTFFLFLFLLIFLRFVFILVIQFVYKTKQNKIK